MGINLDKGYYIRAESTSLYQWIILISRKTIAIVFTYMRYKTLENDYRKPLMVWHNP
jgi:hypothetical protein